MPRFATFKRKRGGVSENVTNRLTQRFLGSFLLAHGLNQQVALEVQVDHFKKIRVSPSRLFFYVGNLDDPKLGTLIFIVFDLLENDRLKGWFT